MTQMLIGWSGRVCHSVMYIHCNTSVCYYYLEVIEMTVKHDSMYTMRINKEIKEKAEIVARQSGLSLSGVVKALFIQMNETGAIPFDIRLTQNVRYHAAMDTSHMTHDEIIDKAMKEVINENIETLKVLAK